MARRKTITDEQILEAARAVFLRQGYGAGTAVIAREAGISEGSIFNRFKTKAELFQRAMGLPDESELLEVMAPLDAGGEVRETLRETAIRIGRMQEKVLPIVMMLRCHPAVGSGALDALVEHPDPPPLRIVRLLTEYLERESEAGHVRPSCPATTAELIFSALHRYGFVRSAFPARQHPESIEEYVDSVLDVLWEGIKP